MVSSLPSEPGVYWFLDENDNVLYVGKAKNLKKRVSSYTYLKRLQNRIHQMVITAKNLKHKVLSSELEALLVEAELIRTYLPQFNVALKDDKSPLYIQITDEAFPRVNTVRKKELIAQRLQGTIIGPFQSAYKAREVLQIARGIFHWCNSPANTQRGSTKRPCFYYHIGLCSGACINKISPADYQFMIQKLTLFLRGKTKEVLVDLENQMQLYAQQEQFEKAAIIRDQVTVIKQVTSPGYKLRPDLLLSVSLTSNESAEQIIHLRKLLYTYQAVPRNYKLNRIETYDVSNIQGELAAVAMVTAVDGAATPSEYRLFNIRTLNTPNDYHMMKEAITRRQNHAEWGTPSLIVIDGGKGQLRAALSVWYWRVPVISIAKDPDRIIIPILDWNQEAEKKHAQLENLEYHIVKLPDGHPALKLIQKMRDEAHRFSKKQYTRRKLKSMFT